MEDNSPHSTANIDSTLLSRIAHDMRGNFNGLIGFSDLLDSNFDTLSDEQKKDYAHLLKVLSFQSFLGNLTMLTWIKIISKNLNLNITAVSFSDLVKLVCQFCGSALENKHCDIKNTSSSPLYVEADIHHLSIGIANIIISILNITESKSTVLLSIEQTTPQKRVITLSFKMTENAKQSPIKNIIQQLPSFLVPENNIPLWVTANILKEHHAEMTIQDTQLLVINISI